MPSPFSTWAQSSTWKERAGRHWKWTWWATSMLPISSSLRNPFATLTISSRNSKRLKILRICWTKAYPCSWKWNQTLKSSSKKMTVLGKKRKPVPMCISKTIWLSSSQYQTATSSGLPCTFRNPWTSIKSICRSPLYNWVLSWLKNSSSSCKNSVATSTTF